MRWVVAALALAACGTDGGTATVDAGAAGQDAASGADAQPGQDSETGDAVAPEDGTVQDTAGPDVGGADAAADAAADGGADVQGTDAGAPQTPGAFCVDYGAAWCGLLDRCPPPWRAAWSGGCVSALTAGCQSAWLDAAAASGDLVFDGTAATACLGSLDTMSCADADALWLAQGDNVPDTCKAAQVGALPAGSGCVVGPECEAGTVCVVLDACPGTCTAQGGPGEPCAKGELCAWPETVCLEGTCTALPDTAGAPCVSGLCRTPLVCEAGACVTPGLAEQPCGDGAVCYPGLICFRPSDQQAGTCKLPRTVGQTCFESWQCDAASAAGRLVCAGGTCNVAPGSGEPCWEYTCDQAVCDAAQIPPTCVALPGVGSPCWQGGACATGAFCDGGTCKALGVPGDPCEGHYQCASLRCYAGVCVAPDQPPCPL